MNAASRRRDRLLGCDLLNVGKEVPGSMTGQSSPNSPRSELERFVISLVGDDYSSMSFDELAAPFRRLSAVERNRLLHKCKIALERARDSDEASVAAEVLIALYPDSLATIEHLLRQRGPKVWESHFQLFFRFSNISGLPLAFQRNIESLIERYLMSVDRNAASAAWMAGDCLGDHWPAVRALPILIRVSRSARFRAGRCAAIHGLTYIVKRLRSARRAGRPRRSSITTTTWRTAGLGRASTATGEPFAL